MCEICGNSNCNIEFSELKDSESKSKFTVNVQISDLIQFRNLLADLDELHTELMRRDQEDLALALESMLREFAGVDEFVRGVGDGADQKKD